MPTSQDATVFRWEDLEQDSPMDLITRRRIIGDRFMVSEVHLAKGFSVPSHRHENEQIAMVMHGRIRFTIGEGDAVREETLVGGQVLHLPSDVPHGAEALEDTLIYDLFSPVSEKTGIDRE
ncbi:MAG: cupin domain-containing protein [Planctomycetota bacterium]|nr:cupin domain-containing protein [Planctomycetota bacterium]